MNKNAFGEIVELQNQIESFKEKLSTSQSLTRELVEAFSDFHDAYCPKGLYRELIIRAEKELG